MIRNPVVGETVKVLGRDTTGTIIAVEQTAWSGTKKRVRVRFDKLKIALWYRRSELERACA